MIELWPKVVLNIEMNGKINNDRTMAEGCTKY